MATGPEFAACSAAGSHWRGKDCDETRGDVYPGRKSSVYNASVDHNCNGIYGTDEVLARENPPSQFEPGCTVKRKALSPLDALSPVWRLVRGKVLRQLGRHGPDFLGRLGHRPL